MIVTESAARTGRLVLVAGSDRIGLASRLAVLALAWKAVFGGSKPVLVVGETASRCLDGMTPGVERLTWRGGDLLSRRLDDLERDAAGPARVRVVLWDLPVPSLLDELAPLRPIIVIETWPPGGSVRRAMAIRRRLEREALACFYCGLWPLIESPEERVALSALAEKLEPWSAALLTRPCVGEAGRPTVLVIGQGLESESRPALVWQSAAHDVLAGVPGVEGLVLVAGIGEVSPVGRFAAGVTQAGILPSLAEEFSRARSAVIPVSAALALLARGFEVPAVIVPADTAEERRAGYLAVLYGHTVAPSGASPAEILGLSLGPDSSGAPAAPAGARPSQERAVRAAVQALAR